MNLQEMGSFVLIVVILSLLLGSKDALDKNPSSEKKLFSIIAILAVSIFLTFRLQITTVIPGILIGVIVGVGVYSLGAFLAKKYLCKTI